jgi:hypothetical protein
MKNAVTYESVMNQLQEHIANDPDISIRVNIGFQIWEAEDYLEENALQLTKHQKQELQRAIDDLYLYKEKLKMGS